MPIPFIVTSKADVSRNADGGSFQQVTLKTPDRESDSDTFRDRLTFQDSQKT